MAYRSQSSSSFAPSGNAGHTGALDDDLARWGNFFDEKEQEIEANEVQRRDFVYKKDCVVFLIDASPAMFALSPETGESPFVNALRCVEGVMKDKIIASSSDMMSVVFYGTEQKENPNGVEGVYVHSPLDSPDAQRIMDLQRLIRKYEPEVVEPGDDGSLPRDVLRVRRVPDSANSSQAKTDDDDDNNSTASAQSNKDSAEPQFFGVRESTTSFVYGHCTHEFPLGDALWACSTIFSQAHVSAKNAVTRVFLFTNEDNPNAGSPMLRDQAYQRARDMADLGISLELFLIGRSVAGRQRGGAAGGGAGAGAEAKSDYTLFYRDLLACFPGYDPENGEEGQIEEEVNDRFHQLQSRVRKKEFKKRTLAQLPLRLADGLELAVNLYTLAQPTKQSTAVPLDDVTSQPLKRMTKSVCEDTGAVLLDSQIRHWHEYGGHRVIFSKEELARIKSLGTSPGMQLIGFKPRSAISQRLNIKHAGFVYPNDRQIVGSTVAFVALWQKMLELDRVAICRVAARAATAPRFVALVPQQEETNTDGVQESPPGMHLIYLPFMDDFREAEHKPMPKPAREAIAKARKLVNSLVVKYDPANFENPALQTHFAALQTMALDQDQPEQVEDHTLPDLSGMAKFEPDIKAFGDAVFPDSYVHVQRTKPRAPSSSSSSAAGLKRERSTTSSVSSAHGSLHTMDATAIAAMGSGGLKKFKVTELKAFVALNKIKCETSTSTRYLKDDYIRGIDKWVTSQLSRNAGGPSSSPSPASKRARVKDEQADDSTVVGGNVVDDDSVLQDVLSTTAATEARVPGQSMSSLDNQSESQADTSVAGGRLATRDRIARSDPRPLCKYGKTCARKNMLHRKSFRHE